ncbi:MAG TPA: fibronectin type III domain-containing protein [Verrucomicrobiae bacterium]
MKFLLTLALLGFVASARTLATQEAGGLLPTPFFPTPDNPTLDSAGSGGLRRFYGPVTPKAAGPIAPAGTQPHGALSGRIIFTSAGHGWAWNGSAWALGRPLLNSMTEDYGNLDQMTMFVYYCFNAGATVVSMRPVGHQTNEVVLDNTSPAVTWAGEWADSSSTVYYGQAGAVPYRFATISTNETATATYAPTIPSAGFYPVYSWVLSGANRTNQLYRINHTGGQSLVRVPHHMVGNGWVYLGTYSFNAGSNAVTGAVVISNLGEGTNVTGVAIADAVRFGNGMGDVDRGGGVSGYPREEECSRYWVQRSLGQGQSSTLYDSPTLSDSDDNVRTPIRMAVEMNREAAGDMFQRLYVGFHSNAGGGRGVLGLYNDPTISPTVETNSNTPNQYRLAQMLGTEVNNDMSVIGVPPLEQAWYNRGGNIAYARTDYAFGEINNNTISNEFDASMVEVAFHDNVSDAKLLCDSKARNWVARASYHGVVRYMNQFAGVPMNLLPEPPFNVRAAASSGAVVISWAVPVVQGGSGAPTAYVVYQSSDGYGFGSPVSVEGAGATSLALTNLTAGTDYYFRVAAVNAGGESFPSETVGCRRSSNPFSSRILFVNGFTRFDRTLNLRQTPTPQQYRPPGHDGNSGTMDRVLPRRVNAFDYVVPHGKAIAAASLMGFDSCQVQAVTNGTVNLADYQIVVWAAGNQSAADQTFNPAAQAKVSAFLAGGGNLYVSGADIAWDLDRASGPTASDRDFLHNQLHAALNSDTNNDSGVYTFSAAAGSIFGGNAAGLFDDGSRGIYWVAYPDALTPVGPGTVVALNYPGYGGGAAAVSHDGSAEGAKVIYFGFPFEAVTASAVRNAYMADVLKSFSRPARFESATLTSDRCLQLSLSGEPGFTYQIQYATDFSNWTTFTNIVNAGGMFGFVDDAVTGERKFYRATLAF